MDEYLEIKLGTGMTEPKREQSLGGKNTQT